MNMKIQITLKININIKIKIKVNINMKIKEGSREPAAPRVHEKGGVTSSDPPTREGGSPRPPLS
jgi:hypothetical protein